MAPSDRHDSLSPPAERVEHALTVLASVEATLRAAVATLEEQVGEVSESVVELADELAKLTDTVAGIRRDMARESLSDSEIDAAMVARITELERAVAAVKAAERNSVGAVELAGAEAASKARRGAVLWTAVQAVLAALAALAAAYEHFRGLAPH
jgi:septal ring factor EnvC (AmiA/AmiB activator)